MALTLRVKGDAKDAIKALKDVGIEAKETGKKTKKSGKTITSSMVKGSLAHGAMLEPDTYEKEFARQPEGHGNSKAVKEAKAAMREQGITPVPTTDWDTVHRAVTYARSHAEVQDLFVSGAPEVSGFWQDDETGLWCKLRCDWLDKVRGIAVDYKTSSIFGSASPATFGKTIANRGMHIQMVHYLEGLRVLTGDNYDWLWLMHEVIPPYAYGLFAASPDMVASGHYLWRKGIDTLAETEGQEHVAAWRGGVHEVDLPSWAKERFHV